MKQFLVKLGGFVLIQTVLLAWLISFYQAPYPVYMQINEKHAMAQAAAPPRLFIFGGSSTPLAFDSPMIQEATGYHVVNMGLNGELHREFILNQALDVVRRGDVVILAFEHGFFTRQLPRSGFQIDMMTRMLLMRPSIVKYIEWSDLKLISDQALVFLHGVLRASLHSMKNPRRDNGRVPVETNIHGDWVRFHLHATRPLAPYRVDSGFENDDDAIDAVIADLNRFAKQCHRRGVKVYFFYGPYPNEYFQPNRLFLERVHRRLISRADFPILGEPADTAAPASVFLDNEYHVNPELRRHDHTRLFIERFTKVSGRRL